MIEYKEVKYGEHTDIGYEKIIWPDGDIQYLLNGKIHREDGPAWIKPTGYQTWCINDNFHRENCPARIYSGGSQAWYIHGKRHCEDGPAIIWNDGEKEYWLNDIHITPSNYHLFSPLQLAKLGLI